MLLFYLGWHYVAVVWFSVQKQSQRNNRSSLQHYSVASVVKEANVVSVKGLKRHLLVLHCEVLLTCHH